MESDNKRLPHPKLNPQRRHMRMTLLLGAVGIAGAVLAWLLDADPAATAALALTWLIVDLVILAVFYQTGKKQLRRIAALLDGERIAHWHCPPDVWNAFAAAQRLRLNRTLLIVPLLTAGLLAIIGLVLLLFSEAGLSPAVFFLVVILGCCTGLFIVLPLQVKDRSRYRSVSAAPVEIIVGRQGIYQNGMYCELRDTMVSLASVEFKEGDPPVLEFRTVFSSNPRYPSASRGGDVIYTPVPPGREAEASDLVQELWSGTSG